MKSFSEKAIINMVENLFKIDSNTVKYANKLSYFKPNNNDYFLVFGEKSINIFLNGILKKRYIVNQSNCMKEAELNAKSIYSDIKNNYCV